MTSSSFYSMVMAFLIPSMIPRKKWFSVGIILKREYRKLCADDGCCRILCYLGQCKLWQVEHPWSASLLSTPIVTSKLTCDSTWVAFGRYRQPISRLKQASPSTHLCQWLSSITKHNIHRMLTSQNQVQDRVIYSNNIHYSRWLLYDCYTLKQSRFAAVFWSKIQSNSMQKDYAWVLIRARHLWPCFWIKHRITYGDSTSFRIFSSA